MEENGDQPLLDNGKAVKKRKFFTEFSTSPNSTKSGRLRRNLVVDLLPHGVTKIIRARVKSFEKLEVARSFDNSLHSPLVVVDCSKDLLQELGAINSTLKRALLVGAWLIDLKVG